MTYDNMIKKINDNGGLPKNMKKAKAVIDYIYKNIDNGYAYFARLPYNKNGYFTISKNVHFKDAESAKVRNIKTPLRIKIIFQGSAVAREVYDLSYYLISREIFFLSDFMERMKSDAAYEIMNGR